MKSSDQQQLQELYEKISWKGALAGAALGMNSMSPSFAGEPSGMTSDDYADKAMIDTIQSSEELSPRDAFSAAIELIHTNQKIPNELIRLITQDTDLTKRCSNLMILKGMSLPPQFKKIVGNLEDKIKSSIVGP